MDGSPRPPSNNRRHTIVRRLPFLVVALAVPGLLTAGGVEAEAQAPPALEPVVVADGLEVPWAMDFAPDGRIFLTERPGRVRIVDPERGLLPEAWIELDVAEGGDGGLQGIALDPDFETTGHVYVMGTFPGPGEAQRSRILRFTEREGRGTDPTTIFGPVSTAGVHRGGGLAFGPDGMLYASLGDTRALDAPQDPRDPRGSILRLAPDGSTPADGPFPGSPVFAVGVRNPQGLAFDPASGTLFASEHGPSNFPGEHGWGGRDEVNAIVPGGNYGWPEVAGDTIVDGFRRPIASWTPSLAPGGLAVQRPEGAVGPVLWVGGLAGERLVRLEAVPARESPGWRVARERSYLRQRFGRIRAVAVSPDGALYFTTSNRDSEGATGAPPDRLFRVEVGPSPSSFPPATKIPTAARTGQIRDSAGVTIVENRGEHLWAEGSRRIPAIRRRTAPARPAPSPG